MADKITSKKNREKFGDSNQKYPINSEHSAISAINLRHNSPDTDPSSVLNRASRWANKAGNETVKTKVKEAREKDKGK